MGKGTDINANMAELSVGVDNRKEATSSEGGLERNQNGRRNSTFQDLRKDLGLPDQNMDGNSSILAEIQIQQAELYT